MIPDAMFTGLLESAADAARDAYARSPDATHPPLLVFMDGEDEMQTCVLHDLEHKDAACEAMRFILAREKAYAYMFVSECWVSCPRHAPEDWKKVLPPSKDPERKEAVIIYGRYPSGRKVLLLGMIEDGEVEPLTTKADTEDGTWAPDEDRFGTLLDPR